MSYVKCNNVMSLPGRHNKPFTLCRFFSDASKLFMMDLQLFESVLPKLFHIVLNAYNPLIH
jgi:hypothetical protein